jgi:hypothetical protein
MTVGERSEDIDLVYPSEYMNGKTATGNMFAQILRGTYALANMSKRVLASTVDCIDMTAMLSPDMYLEKQLNASTYTTLYTWRIFVPAGATLVHAFVAWRVLTPATITHRLVVTGAGADTGTAVAIVNTSGGKPEDVYPYNDMIRKVNSTEDRHNIFGSARQGETIAFTAARARLGIYDESNIQSTWMSVTLSNTLPGATAWATVESKGQSSSSAGSTDAHIMPVSAMCVWE